jgi:hypothetical protein
MATDIGKMLSNLLSFYDFSNKRMISVGAGGAKLLGYEKMTTSIIAIDSDLKALDSLSECAKTAGIFEKFSFVGSKFSDFSGKADLLMFDFCLHEMPDPSEALEHARELVKDIIVFDHYLESEWAHYTGETEIIKASWAAIGKAKPRRVQHYSAVQKFTNYEELFKKLEPLGPKIIKGIEKFKNSKNIVMQMPYAAALL